MAVAHCRFLAGDRLLAVDLRADSHQRRVPPRLARTRGWALRFTARRCRCLASRGALGGDSPRAPGDWPEVTVQPVPPFGQAPVSLLPWQAVDDAAEGGICVLLALGKDRARPVSGMSLGIPDDRPVGDDG